MEESLNKGDVVVLPFPFSDLSSHKKRPALIIADLDGDDLLLCQITSSKRLDNYAINLGIGDFISGKLPHESRIRPNKIFTGDKSIILYKSGWINKNKIKEVETKLIEIITN
jgi:mRNA interferase MazF